MSAFRLITSDQAQTASAGALAALKRWVEYPKQTKEPDLVAVYFEAVPQRHRKSVYQALRVLFNESQDSKAAKGSGTVHQHRPIFTLCQMLQGAVVEAGQEPLDLDDLKPFHDALSMFCTALDGIGLEIEDGLDYSDPLMTRLELGSVWTKVKVPSGCSQVTIYARKLPRVLLLKSPDGDEDLKGRLEQILTAAWHMGASTKGRFFLSCEMVGNHFGKSGDCARKCGSLLLDRICKLGLLDRTEVGKLTSRKASEFQFLADRNDLYKLAWQ